MTETALLASHHPSSIALFFCFPSWRNFLESIYTSCLYFLTFCSLSSLFQPGFHPPHSTETAFVKSLARSPLPSLLNTFLSSPPSTSQKHSTQLAAAPFWKGSIHSASMKACPWFPSYLSATFSQFFCLFFFLSLISKVSQGSIWVWMASFLGLEIVLQE